MTCVTDPSLSSTGRKVTKRQLAVRRQSLEDLATTEFTNDIYQTFLFVLRLERKVIDFIWSIGGLPEKF